MSNNDHDQNLFLTSSFCLRYHTKENNRERIGDPDQAKGLPILIVSSTNEGRLSIKSKESDVVQKLPGIECIAIFLTILLS